MSHMMRRYHEVGRWTVAALLVAAGSLDLRAQSVNSWTGTAGGFWTNASSWSRIQAPGNTDSADYITNASSKMVTIDANTPAGELTISNLYITGQANATNTLLLSANSTPLTAGSGTIAVDSASGTGLGAMVIDGGQLAGWSNTIYIGQTHAGSLVLSNAASLSVSNLILGNLAGSQGTLTMAGTGPVTIRDGGLHVGNAANATGTVMMTGGTLMCTNGNPSSGPNSHIGGATGVGSMTVSNGLFEASYLFVGVGAGTRGTLSICGGTNVFYELLMGSSGVNTSTVVMTGGLLVITNMNGQTSPYLHIGAGAANVASMTVSGGSVSNFGPLDIAYTVNSRGALTNAGGSIYISQGLLISTGTNSVGSFSMTNGSLTVVGTGANGALNLNSGVSNNTATYTQSGGVSTLGTAATQTNYVGYVAGGVGTYNLFGGTSTLNGNCAIAFGANSTGNVCISGGQFTEANTVYNGFNGHGSMTVSNGIWSTPWNYVGYNAGAGGTLTIVGGTGTLGGGTYVGYAAGSTGTVMMSGGSLVSPGVNLCQNGTVAANASFMVCSGAVLEVNAISSPGINGSGGFSNQNGGVLQFAMSTPTIMNNNSNVVVNNATIAFRAIANADVKGNWSGSQLTNICWQGANTFCLNAASNTTTINQDYTFASGLAASNYACLKLLNGAVYRNGNVTIGNGGTLAVQGGSCTIASNLTLNSQSTLAMTVGGGSDCLIVTNGTANLGGATLQLAFNTCPTNLYPLTILRAGTLMNSFGASRLLASYGGANYTIYINKSGNNVVLNSKITPPPGTAIVFW